MSRDAWAKLDEKSTKALPLSDHGTGVAAVTEALFDAGWFRRLERSAGRPLVDADRDLLLALAFLHDLGKTNDGFWLRQCRRARTKGHTSIVLSLCRMSDWQSRLPLLHALLIRCQKALFRAVLSHHGRPVQLLPEHGISEANSVWKSSNRFGYGPSAQLEVASARASALKGGASGAVARS